MSSSQISTGGHGNSRTLVPAATMLLSRAFLSDPLVNYMLSSLPAANRAAYIPHFFKALLTAATLNRASIDRIADRFGNRSEEKDGEGGKGVQGECGQWKCYGVLMPPGERVDNPWTLFPAGLPKVAWRVRWGGCMRILHEFPSLTALAKKKGLKGHKRYYYVFFVGTEAAARGQGLCSAIMRDYQARSAKEGLPVWLEATTEKSMKIYLKLGWEVVEEMVLGKGKAKADGTLMKGGEGVKVWAMVWWPPTKTGES